MAAVEHHHQDHLHQEYKCHKEGFMASRVDPKLLERPIAFTGLAKDWRAWRVRFSAWLTGVDEKYDLCLKQAEAREKDPIVSVDASIMYLDRFSFIQLIGLVQGEYLDMILEAPFGFEAWR